MRSEGPATIPLLKRLLGHMGSSKRIVIACLVMLYVACSLLILAPKVAGNLLDYLSECIDTATDINMGTVLFIIVIIAVLYLLGYGLNILSAKYMRDVSGSIVHGYRIDIHRKLHKVPISYIDAHPHGDITARLTSDLSEMESLIRNDVLELFKNITLLVFVLLMMLSINLKLAVVYMLLMPVTVVLMTLISRRIGRSTMEQQVAVGEINGYLGDVIVNRSLIRSYNRESHFEGKFDVINERYHVSSLDANRTNALIEPLSILINNTGYICTAIFGGFMILSGELTLGGFMAYILYGQMISGPLTTTVSTAGLVQSELSALDRVFQVIDLEEEPDESGKKGLDPSSVRGEVRFDDVVFGYDGDRNVLDGVSFTAEPGTITAIVGPSGSGKTTVINLLMRFYEIQGGSITLDGEDIRDISRDELRKAFGMVLQESWVFDGTIAENIGYGKEGATMDEIRMVSRIVGCDEFIEGLPNGYDTMISEENLSFSAGEKQLLVLARTILSDPKILILDEATSKMDLSTELLVTKAMEDIMIGKTTFVIAHRLFTIRNADKIIFLDDGKIREVGTHDELMRLDGRYAEMYRSMSI